MRNFITVLKYEMKEYFTNKVFMGLTIFLALAGALVLFLPRFVDMSGFTGVKIVGGNDTEENSSQEEKELLLYLDKAGVIRPEVLGRIYPDADWQEAASLEALKKSVEEQEA